MADDHLVEERSFEATLDNYDYMREFIQEMAEAIGMPLRGRLRLELGMEEALVNILKYAYQGKETGQVWIRVEDRGDGTMGIDLFDHGVPFDPLTRSEPDHTLGVEERKVGGYGIHFMRQTFSHLEYHHEMFEGKLANHLHLEYDPAKKPATAKSE